MGLIKNLLIAVLVILCIGAIGYVALRYLPTEKWFGQKVTAENLVPFVQQNLAGAQQLTASLPIPQLQGITSGISNLSTPKEKTAQNVPAYQRAFEYSRYQYCQQVVKDYEKRYSSVEDAQ